MKIRSYVAAGVLLALGVIITASGCSRQPTSPFRGVFPREGPTLNDPENGDSIPPPPPPPGDSVPPPPPPPPPPAPILPIAFAGADSAAAGTIATLHWAVGNESEASFRVDYSMECALPWPGFPLTGHITVPARTVAPLDLIVNVPADAVTGMVEFTMSVTRPNGIPPTTASGSLRVVSDQPPPPPPPPPIPPVAYLGADTVVAGGDVHQSWQVRNESQATFTMRWSLEPRSPWPGYPVSGQVQLAAGGSATVFTTGAVPDTAGPGTRFTRLVVTRPDGLPPASTDGAFMVHR